MTNNKKNMKKSSNNFKEKFEKIKFLVPLIIGLVIVYFICATDVFDSKVMMSLAVMGLTVYRTIHEWRVVYDSDYSKRHRKILEKEMRKPWYARTSNYPLERGVFLIMTLSLISAAGLAFTFCRNGFLTQNWNSSQLILAVISLIIFFACVRLYKK